MRVKGVICSDKTVIDYGRWNRGEGPRAQFPLRKKKLKLSRDWVWRIVSFDALESRFIVLIRLNQQIEEYYAHLAHVREDGIAVICSHDLHVSHKNWHCHFVPGDTRRIDIGYLRDKDNTVCFPSGRSVPCTVSFDVTMGNAVEIAAKRFRFPPPLQKELFDGA